MADLLVLGVIGAVALLWGADRAIKARARGKRMREMSERLAAAAARADEQLAEREAQEAASAELTSFIPAINLPPQALARQVADGAEQPPPGG
jgi:type VI protein secretion system component VasK